MVPALRDTLIAGVFFLLPLLLLSVLLKKAWGMMHALSARLATALHLDDALGPAAAVVVAGTALVLLCLLSGWLVRFGMLAQASRWLDDKLTRHLPGYAVFRQMASNQLEDHSGVTPYKEAALLKQDDGEIPVFVVEHLSDGRSVLFIPTAGNPGEGGLLLAETNKLNRLGAGAIKPVKICLANMGIGLAEVVGKQVNATL